MAPVPDSSTKKAPDCSGASLPFRSRRESRGAAARWEKHAGAGRGGLATRRNQRGRHFSRRRLTRRPHAERRCRDLAGHQPRGAFLLSRVPERPRGNVLVLTGKRRPPFGVLEVDSRSPRQSSNLTKSSCGPYANLLGTRSTASAMLQPQKTPRSPSRTAFVRWLSLTTCSSERMGSRQSFGDRCPSS